MSNHKPCKHEWDEIEYDVEGDWDGIDHGPDAEICLNCGDIRNGRAK